MNMTSQRAAQRDVGVELSFHLCVSIRYKLSIIRSILCKFVCFGYIKEIVP